MKALALVLAVFAVLALPSRALAADLGIVGKEGDVFVVRLIRELEQLGLSVTKSTTLDGSSDVAVLVVDKEIDLYDRQPDGTRRKRHLVAAKGDALKVAEEVHALMLPLVERPPEPARASPLAIAPPPPLEKPIAPAPAPRRAPFEAHASAGALLGGATPGLVVTLGLAYPEALRFGDLSLGGGIAAIVAAVPEKISADAGTTDIRPVMFGPELDARYALSRSFFTELALGAFAANVRFTARAAAPFATRDESAWTFAPNARLRAQYMLGVIGLFAEGRLGIAVSPIAVRFVGEEVHEWGSPWATASGGLAVVF